MNPIVLFVLFYYILSIPFDPFIHGSKRNIISVFWSFDYTMKLYFENAAFFWLNKKIVVVFFFCLSIYEIVYIIRRSV